MSARDLAAAVRAEPVLVKLRRVSVRTDLYASEAASLLAYVAALEKQAADAQDSPNLRAAFTAVDEDRRKEKAARVRTEEALRQIAAHREHDSNAIDCLEACMGTADAVLAAAGADTAQWQTVEIDGRKVDVYLDEQPVPGEDAWERPSFCRAAPGEPCVSAECRCREEA